MTDLRDVFAAGDYELVVEALYALRERKQAALDDAGQHDITRMFTARDFGIPQIDAILKRMDAESAADPSAERPPAAPVKSAAVSERGHIGIRLEGGVIQSVWTDRPMDVVVLDYDTEGCSPEDLFQMPQSGGGTSECLVGEYAAAVMPEECQRIIAALDAREETAEFKP